MCFQLMENTRRSREILTPAHGRQYFVSSEALPCYSKREKQPPNTLFLFPFQLRGLPGWQDFHTRLYLSWLWLQILLARCLGRNRSWTPPHFEKPCPCVHPSPQLEHSLTKSPIFWQVGFYLWSQLRPSPNSLYLLLDPPSLKGSESHTTLSTVSSGFGHFLVAKPDLAERIWHLLFSSSQMQDAILS